MTISKEQYLDLVERLDRVDRMLRWLIWKGTDGENIKKLEEVGGWTKEISDLHLNLLDNEPDIKDIYRAIIDEK